MMLNIISTFRWKKWLRKVALIFIIGLVVLLCAHLVWGRIANADLDTAQQEALISGLIVGHDKIIPVPCPPDQNAALLYRRAFGLLTLESNKPYVPGGNTAVLDNRIQKLLNAKDTPTEKIIALLDGRDFARIWELFDEGSRLPRCRFDYNYDDGSYLHLPELGLWREVNRLSLLRVRALIDQGRRQDAVDTISAQLRIRHQLLEEPLQLSQYLYDNFLSEILVTLRDMIHDRRLQGCELGNLLASLRTDGRDNLAARNLQAEVAFVGGWFFRCLDDGDLIKLNAKFDNSHESDSWLFSLYTSWIGLPWRRGDEAAYLRVMSQNYAALLKHDPFPPLPPRSIGTPLLFSMIPSFELLNENFTDRSTMLSAGEAAVTLLCKGLPKPHPRLKIDVRPEGGWVIHVQAEKPSSIYNSDKTLKKNFLDWIIPGP